MRGRGLIYVSKNNEDSCWRGLPLRQNMNVLVWSLTCPGTAGGRSLGRQAEWTLYAAKAASELRRTRCYCYLAGNREGSLTWFNAWDFSSRPVRCSRNCRASPVKPSWFDSWCFWWCSLRHLSDCWFSAWTWNKAPSESQQVRAWDRRRHFWRLSRRKGEAYWKKLYFASLSSLSMLIWNTLRPLVLCWQRCKYCNNIYLFSECDSLF